jgi:hypothetical protein
MFNVKYDLNEPFKNPPVFDAPLMNFNSQQKKFGQGKNLAGIFSKAIVGAKHNERYKYFGSTLDATTCDEKQDYSYQIGKKFPIQYLKVSPHELNLTHRNQAEYHQNINKVK